LRLANRPYLVEPGGTAHDRLDAMITGYPAQFCSTEFTANHLTSAIIDLSSAE
jgi:hypothetical protein